MRKDVLSDESKKERTDQLITNALSNSRVSLNTLELMHGKPKQEAIRLIEAGTKKSIQLKDFGLVDITDLTITGEHIFLMAEGQRVKFNRVRLTLIRNDQEIESCRKPEWFLTPPRDITEADLVDPRKWVEPMADHGKLEVANFIMQTLSCFSEPQFGSGVSEG